jgi:hypothetical protein
MHTNSSIKIFGSFIGVLLSLNVMAAEIVAVKNISDPAPESDVLTVVLQGSFGAAPEVAYYNDFRDEAIYGSLSKTTAFAGATDWNVATIPPSIGVYEGQPGFFAVDAETDKTSIIYARLGKTYENIFMAYSVAIPKGKTAPLASSVGQWGGGSNWKLSWMLETADAYKTTEQFDMCGPTLVGNNSSLSGNSAKFLHPKGWTYVHAQVSNWWAWDSYNHLAVTLNGSATPVNGSFSVVNKQFSYINFPMAEGTLYSGPKPQVSQVNFPGWVRDSTDDHFQAIYSNIYIAGGENFLSRIELTDSKTYEDSTYRRVVYPTSWNKDEIKFDIYEAEIRYQGAKRDLYVHYFGADGARNPNAIKACIKCPGVAEGI